MLTYHHHPTSVANNPAPSMVERKAIVDDLQIFLAPFQYSYIILQFKNDDLTSLTVHMSSYGMPTFSEDDQRKFFELALQITGADRFSFFREPLSRSFNRDDYSAHEIIEMRSKLASLADDRELNWSRFAEDYDRIVARYRAP
jgi:hypothetical protein